MLFTGTYKHAIDAKHRLAIPADVRAMLAKEAGQIEGSATPVFLFVTIEDESSLCLYDEKRFEQIAEKLMDADWEQNGQLSQYLEMRLSHSKKVELDKVGRIRLPDDLLEWAELGNDVVLLGVGDRLVVRDRQQWEDKKKEAIADKRMLLNPRKALKEFTKESDKD